MYQEYPRHLHKAERQYCVVQNDDEKALALAEGWLLAPPPPEPVADPDPEPKRRKGK